MDRESQPLRPGYGHLMHCLPSCPLLGVPAKPAVQITLVWLLEAEWQYGKEFVG